MHALDTDLRARAADVDEAFRYKVQSRQTALDDALRNMTTLTGVPKL
jgi:hypothetical protein